MARTVSPGFVENGPKLRVLTPLGFFAPKRPNLALFVHCRLIWCPVGRLAGSCGARAVSRKTHIYFIINTNDYNTTALANYKPERIATLRMAGNCSDPEVSSKSSFNLRIFQLKNRIGSAQRDAN